MFIRLTSKYKRLPVWINPQFVASVEKCEHGGCVVGPVGAGVDFEVLEAPERVLALLSAPDSQEVAPPPEEPAAPAPAPAPAPAVPETPGAPADSQPKPKKSTPAKPKGAAKKKSEQKPAAKKPAPGKAQKPQDGAQEPPPPPPAAAPADVGEPPILPQALPEAKLEKLRRLAPGSLGKLRNTLQKQFSVSNPQRAIEELMANAEIVIDGNRVLWSHLANAAQQQKKPVDKLDVFKGVAF